MRVYLNCTREDLDSALGLYNWLLDRGFTPWLAEKDVLPGQSLAGEVRRVVEEMDVCIALFSRSREALSFNINEVVNINDVALKLILNLKRPLIPVRIEPCEVPREVIERRQSIDLFVVGASEKLERRLQRLERPGQIDPELEPPDALVQACVDDDCVLYVGSGLSVPAGFPIWRDFVSELLQWAGQSGMLSGAREARLSSAAEAGAFALVADNIVRNVQDAGRESELHAWLAARYTHSIEPLPPRHQLLRDIGFAAVLTTNFDTLLERTFETGQDRVLTPSEPEQLLAALTTREFFIAKLYGRLDQPDSVMISPAQYEDFIAENRVFADLMQSLFVSRTVLFIGCSLEGIADHLEGLRLRNTQRPHYALAAVWDDLSETKAEQLRHRYGIHVLPYATNPEHAEVDDFLRALAERVQVRRSSRLAMAESQGAAAERHPGLLRSLSLKNIGPFDTLDLELDPQWNVLLGDNGVGKSTILKAIALAFCGRGAETFADRLLAFNKQQGQIVLRTDRETYTTILSRTQNGVEVSSLPGRPLENEGWLALGFPPLRMVSWRPARETARDDGQPLPVADDLLPLLSGEPDPRLDDLKDWLYSFDSWSYRLSPDSANALATIREDLFRILREITGNLDIAPHNDDHDTQRVMINLQGRPMPLEAVSQGTASLFGWLGVLLRRLYRIYGSEPDALKRPALVLLDEIDAHMHPAWQQALIPKLKSQFPQVQFIATTHSPLVLSNVENGAIYRLERDRESGLLRAQPGALPPTGMGVAGLLTSPFFGLRSELDDKTQSLLDDKVDLVTQEEPLSPEQKQKLSDINQQLDKLGLLNTFSDPYYTAFLRALARRRQLQAFRRPTYSTADLERHQQLTDEILAELEAEEQS